MTANVVSSSVKAWKTTADAIFFSWPLHLFMCCFRCVSVDKHMGGRPSGTSTGQHTSNSSKKPHTVKTKHGPHISAMWWGLNVKGCQRKCIHINMHAWRQRQSQTNHEQQGPPCMSLPVSLRLVRRAFLTSLCLSGWQMIEHWLFVKVKGHSSASSCPWINHSCQCYVSVISFVTTLQTPGFVSITFLLTFSSGLWWKPRLCKDLLF